MTRLTSKGIYTVKIRNHPHTAMLQELEKSEKRRVKKDPGDALAVKRTTT